jgi:hypothetical protein
VSLESQRLVLRSPDLEPFIPARNESLVARPTDFRSLRDWRNMPVYAESLRQGPGTTYELFLQIPDGYRPMTSVPPHLSTRSACSVTTSEGAKVITASAAASNSSSVERSEELIARVAPSSSATCR